VALPSHHDGTVAAAHGEALVSGCVAGCRQDEDSRQHLGFAVELLVAQPRRVDQRRQRVAGGAGSLELHPLRQDHAAGQLRIAAAVVEVQVTVDHQPNVIRSDTSRGQRGDQGSAARAVVGIDLRVAHPPCP